MDVSTTNTARLDFHSNDANTSIDYDARIVCTGGIANTITGGALTCAAASHTFTGTMSFASAPKIGN